MSEKLSQQELKTIQKHLPFWDRLNEQEADLIRGSYRVEQISKGTIINRTDEGCKGALLVRNGEIRVYMVSDEGREITLYRLDPGDICVLSASCLLDAIVFDVVIEAIEDTDVVRLPSSVLHRIMEKNPYVELFLAKTANERFSDVMWTMQQLLFMGLDKRIAIFLWDEAARTGKMTIPYTHEEIARLIGSAREAVTRILKYFAREEILKLSRGSIEIISLEKLKSFL